LNHELISYDHIATHLVAVVLVAATSSKNPKAPSFQIGSGRNLAGMFFQENYASTDRVGFFI